MRAWPTWRYGALTTCDASTLTSITSCPAEHGDAADDLLDHADEPRAVDACTVLEGMT
jgi:hypothetical protein